MLRYGSIERGIAGSADGVRQKYGIEDGKRVYLMAGVCDDDWKVQMNKRIFTGKE